MGGSKEEGSCHCPKIGKKAFLVPPKLILPIQHHLQKPSSLSMNWGTLSEMDGDPYSQLKEDGFMVLDPFKKLATCWLETHFGNPELFVSFSWTATCSFPFWVCAFGKALPGKFLRSPQTSWQSACCRSLEAHPARESFGLSAQLCRFGWSSQKSWVATKLEGQ